MFAKKFLIVLAVTLLLATLVSPAMAASSSPQGVIRAPGTTLSVPVYSLPVFLPGHFHLMCECSSSGNCSC